MTGVQTCALPISGQPLRIAEDVLADPSRRQVGQDFFVLGQVIKLGAGTGAVEQGVVGVDHALGVARGARGEEHGGHVLRLALLDGLVKKAGVLCGVLCALGLQFVHGGQAGLFVVAQAARVVKPDVLELRALFADLQQLVDLLLVLDRKSTR